LIRADVADEVAAATSEVDGIHDVRYAPKLVDRLVGVLRILWGITGAIAVLVLVGASLIVSNTIKLTVFARRKEIEIMKLVGGHRQLHTLPLRARGNNHRLSGAGAAAAIVYAGYQGSCQMDFLSCAIHAGCYGHQPPWRCGRSDVVFRAVVGLIGSNIFD